jgi:hypothetical protein
MIQNERTDDASDAAKYDKRSFRGGHPVPASVGIAPSVADS